MRFVHRRQFLGFLAIVALVGGGIVPAGAQLGTPAPYVKVFVDGQPVPSDVPPVIAAGRVLVPLRGVFQRLGAVVTWDPATQMVLAARGDTSISLRIGDPQAHINGEPTLMDVPALLVDGRTMVPLRFLSQALGSQVSWDAANATVRIAISPTYGLPPTQNYPPAAQPPSPSPTQIAGTVVGVTGDAAPGRIQVLVDKTVQTYTITTTTTITRVNVADNSGGSEALDAIRPGDQVQITVDQTGVAHSIHATYREVSGRIIAVTDAGLVVLENGDTFRLNRSARVTRDGKAVEAGALRPGDVVRLRLNPQTNEIWAATIRQDAVRGAALPSVAVTPSGRELKAGDIIEVVATGAPGGHATFSIGGLHTGIPMVESTPQRGTYYGSYTVQPGDAVRGGEVTVRLVASNGDVATAAAPARVQISAGVPTHLVTLVPVITSPGEGATIGTPFTVAGDARPGSRVKVTADYDGSVLLFKVNGSLGTHVVTADQNGKWSVKFSDEPPVFGVNVVITAVEVDGDGRTLSPAARVTTTIK